MFEIYLKLLLEGLVPIGLAVSLFFINKYTIFKKIPYLYQQIIIGILFGGVAIFGTECGVRISDSAVANIRDSGPMVAALLFGGPAGIVAGFIGGIERFAAAYWGAGMYSQVACSISTILAGIISAILRKRMFDQHNASAVGGAVLAVMIEVLHLTIFYLTHINEPYECVNILKELTIPMIVANAFSVGMSCLIFAILMKDNAIRNLKTLNTKIQFALLLLFTSAYLVTTGFIFITQTNYANENADSILQKNTNDVSEHIKMLADERLTVLGQLVNEHYESDPNVSLDYLFTNYYDKVISQINLIAYDYNGTVIESTVPGNEGYQMIGEGSSEQSRDFHRNMLMRHEFVQEFQINSICTDFIKYYGKDIKVQKQGWDCYLQIGINAELFYSTSGVSEKIETFTSHRHVYDNGFLVVFDYDDKVVSDESIHMGVPIGIKGKDLDDLTPFTKYRFTVYGLDSYIMFTESETYYAITVIPVNDVHNARDMMIYVNSFIQIIIYGIIFTVAYFLIEKLVVHNIKSINKTLDLIIDGDLNQKIEPSKTYEFNELGNYMNITVDTLKRYIEQAASRIDKELEFARKIQASSLPNVFPAFPARKDFDIFARMFTARQVGGDFYDFYFVDIDKFAFLVADVSGKGIPASMFMMESKALLKNLSGAQNGVGQVFHKANNSLTQGNEANMFVTSWMGIVDLVTGEVTFANAGHNTPLIYRKKDNAFSYIDQKKNMVLAGMENMQYDEQHIKLEPGDKVFLYTDGVTEATRNDSVLYGEERLLSFLNKHKQLTNQHLLDKLKEDIDNFVDGADQFDDITMLIFEYKGQ